MWDGIRYQTISRLPAGTKQCPGVSICTRAEGTDAVFSGTEGGPAPCLWQPTFIQHEPVWLWARATCHAGCQARTAVLCSVFLQSSDRSCTSSAPPYPCHKTFQGPLHKNVLDIHGNALLQVQEGNFKQWSFYPLTPHPKEAPRYALYSYNIGKDQLAPGADELIKSGLCGFMCSCWLSCG